MGISSRLTKITDYIGSSSGWKCRGDAGDLMSNGYPIDDCYRGSTERRGGAMCVVGETGVGYRGATRLITAFFCFMIGASVVAMAQERSGAPTLSTPGAEVYFVDIKDTDTVSTKLKVHFGLKNMGVAPAGSERPNSGHHHLLIDAELPPLNRPIPNDP